MGALLETAVKEAIKKGMKNIPYNEQILVVHALQVLRAWPEDEIIKQCQGEKK